jgi:hypothetical protein
MLKKIFINSLIALSFILPLVALSIIPTNIHAQNTIVKLSVLPETGNVGSNITITGENFPGSRASIYWDDVAIEKDVTISQDGKFTIDFTIPSASKGIHLISADDNSNWVGGKAEANFNVLPGIDIFPKVTEMQTPILIRGNGFGSNESNIQILVDGKIIPSPQINADNKGYWSATYTVNAIKVGRHTISASSSSTPGSEINTATFILAPWLEVSPASGPVGTMLKIYGWGFMHNEDGITVTMDGVIIEVNTRAEIDGSLIIDGSKREYGTFTSGEEYHDKAFIPKTTQGDHIIGVYGSSFTPRGTLPYYTFTVIPNITVQPSSGHKGTYVTIEGTGFAADENIALKYDNTDAGNSVTADNTGSFSEQYIIPQTSGTENTFTAQGNKGNTATAKFGIDIVDIGTPTIESPTNGQVAYLSDSMGSVYLNAIKYLGGLGNFISGKSTTHNNNSVMYFKWNLDNAPVNAQYDLQISSDNNFKTVAIEQTLNTNVFDLTRNSDLPTGTYYWRVKSSDSSNAEGQWSQTSTFELIAMPTSTAILSIVVLVLIIAAIIFAIILLWNNSVNKYKY